MLTYISIFVTAIFVNNIVLSQFLGICPFLGVSKRIDSALGMGAAVTFVMTIATIVTYLLMQYFRFTHDCLLSWIRYKPYRRFVWPLKKLSM